MSLKFEECTAEEYEHAVTEINRNLGGNHKIFGSTESYQKAIDHLFFAESKSQRPITESLQIMVACVTFSTKPREFLILGKSKAGTEGSKILEELLPLLPKLTNDEYAAGIASAAEKGDDMKGVREKLGKCGRLNFTLMTHISFLCWQYCKLQCSDSLLELHALYNSKRPSEISEENFFMCKEGRGSEEKRAETKSIALKKILFFNSQSMFHKKYSVSLMEFSEALASARRY